MRIKHYIQPIAVFLTLNIILIGLLVVVERETISQTKKNYRYIAANQSNIMRDSVDTAIARVYTFSALIRANNGKTDFFDDQVEFIYKEISQDSGIPVKNVAIAPNGVVKKVYPLANNESLLNFDFMDTSREGNDEAVKAYKEGKVIVTNPFNLVQGGVGMAGRLPVFTKKNGKTSFWGLVTVTLDFDKMIQSFHLNNLEEQGVNYKLWYEDEKGKKVTLTTSQKAVEEPVSYEFDIQNLRWHLDVAPKEHWHSRTQRTAIIFVILGISLLIALLLVDKIKIRNVNEKLEQLAHLDSLTNCYSRHYLNTVLVNQKTGEWNDPRAKYSLAVVDIDNFKNINDTYGHNVGDQAIRAVVHVLQRYVRAVNGDCVIRQGGDEFTIIWNNISKERFQKKLEGIVKDVEKIKFSEYKELHLTISIGGEPYASQGSTRYADLLSKADKKLYVAKENGRNQYVI
ncbi:MAG: sensor domain-containing diguanylate cyclase [Anaerostipes sp.]|jgi:diguanylate cyclase (GGDEF)-like protein